MAIIYKLTSKTSKKSYIGYTTQNLHLRWIQHKSRATRRIDNRHLYNAIRKYGFDDFTREVLEESQDESYTLNVLEPKYIKQYDTFNNGYNLTIGGDGVRSGTSWNARTFYVDDIEYSSVTEYYSFIRKLGYSVRRSTINNIVKKGERIHTFREFIHPRFIVSTLEVTRWFPSARTAGDYLEEIGACGVGMGRKWLQRKIHDISDGVIAFAWEDRGNI